RFGPEVLAMRIELFRRGKGWLPACESAIRVLMRLTEGEIIWVKTIKIRDPKEHRRYWQLMTLCAQNCERVELPYGGTMLIHSKEDVHTAMKLCTGHFDTIFDADQNP